MEPYEQERLRIDVWADAVCPACYLADHRLRAAISASGVADRVDVAVHAFELHPDTPDEVADNSEVLARLMGTSVEQVEAGELRFASIAAADGLPYAVQRTHRKTETVHRVVKLAAEYGVAADLLTAVQRRAFSGDHDAFDHETLVRAAADLGVPEAQVRDVIAGDAHRDAVADDRRTALALGARGVPFVVLGGRVAVPGAASVETYAAAIDQALGVAP